jgi:hypothetical protein
MVMFCVTAYLFTLSDIVLHAQEQKLTLTLHFPITVNVKLSLCLIQYHNIPPYTMKAYGGADV